VIPSQKITIKNEQVLADLAASIAKKLSPETVGATVIGLAGPLGAGKTTFTQKLLAAYGVEGPVTSPTYTIETVYKLPAGPFARCYHLDAYRLEGEEDLEALDFTDRLADPENLIIIEWADRVKAALPSDAIYISIGICGKETREISIRL
jgi:tRNA threonylcarbamoyladenosine biosynthesis protein TsaE